MVLVAVRLVAVAMVTRVATRETVLRAVETAAAARVAVRRVVE